MLTKILTLLALALSMSACNLLDATAPAQETPLVPMATPAVELATYNDLIVGFSFDYPRVWDVLGSNDPEALYYSITLCDCIPLSPERPLGEGLAEGSTKIDFYVDNTINDTNLANAYENWLAMVAQEGGSSSVLVSEERILENGMAVMYLRTSSQLAGEVSSLLMVINGHPVQITLVAGEETNLLAIANSIRIP